MKRLAPLLATSVLLACADSTSPSKEPASAQATVVSSSGEETNVSLTARVYSVDKVSRCLLEWTPAGGTADVFIYFTEKLGPRDSRKSWTIAPNTGSFDVMHRRGTTYEVCVVGADHVVDPENCSGWVAP
jgi:hypothetical protein